MASKLPGSLFAVVRCLLLCRAIQYPFNIMPDLDCGMGGMCLSCRHILHASTAVHTLTLELLTFGNHQPQYTDGHKQ